MCLRFEMSDIKKGRRKSKLEVRNDVDIEETEKTILQVGKPPSCVYHSFFILFIVKVETAKK